MPKPDQKSANSAQTDDKTTMPATALTAATATTPADTKSAPQAEIPKSFTAAEYLANPEQYKDHIKKLVAANRFDLIKSLVESFPHDGNAVFEKALNSNDYNMQCALIAYKPLGARARHYREISLQNVYNSLEVDPKLYAACFDKDTAGKELLRCAKLLDKSNSQHHVSMMNALLAAHPFMDVDVQDNNGNSALHYAVSTEHYALGAKLAARSKFVQNTQRQTAITFTNLKGFDKDQLEIADLYMRHCLSPDWYKDPEFEDNGLNIEVGSGQMPRKADLKRYPINANFAAYLIHLVDKKNHYTIGHDVESFLKAQIDQLDPRTPGAIDLFNTAQPEGQSAYKAALETRHSQSLTQMISLRHGFVTTLASSYRYNFHEIVDTLLKSKPYEKYGAHEALTKYLIELCKHNPQTIQDMSEQTQTLLLRNQPDFFRWIGKHLPKNNMPPIHAASYKAALKTFMGFKQPNDLSDAVTLMRDAIRVDPAIKDAKANSGFDTANEKQHILMAAVRNPNNLANVLASMKDLISNEDINVALKTLFDHKHLIGMVDLKAAAVASLNFPANHNLDSEVLNLLAKELHKAAQLSHSAQSEQDSKVDNSFPPYLIQRTLLTHLRGIKTVAEHSAFNSENLYKAAENILTSPDVSTDLSNVLIELLVKLTPPVNLKPFLAMALKWQITDDIKGELIRTVATAYPDTNEFVRWLVTNNHWFGVIWIDLSDRDLEINAETFTQAMRALRGNYSNLNNDVREKALAKLCEIYRPNNSSAEFHTLLVNSINEGYLAFAKDMLYSGSHLLTTALLKESVQCFFEKHKPAADKKSSTATLSDTKIDVKSDTKADVKNAAPPVKIDYAYAKKYELRPWDKYDPNAIKKAREICATIYDELISAEDNHTNLRDEILDPTKWPQKEQSKTFVLRERQAGFLNSTFSLRHNYRNQAVSGTWYGLIIRAQQQAARLIKAELAQLLADAKQNPWQPTAEWIEKLKQVLLTANFLNDPAPIKKFYADLTTLPLANVTTLKQKLSGALFEPLIQHLDRVIETAAKTASSAVSATNVTTPTVTPAVLNQQSAAPVQPSQPVPTHGVASQANIPAATAAPAPELKS